MHAVKNRLLIAEVFHCHNHIFRIENRRTGNQIVCACRFCGFEVFLGYSAVDLYIQLFQSDTVRILPCLGDFWRYAFFKTAGMNF